MKQASFTTKTKNIPLAWIPKLVFMRFRTIQHCQVNKEKNGLIFCSKQTVNKFFASSFSESLIFIFR